MSKQLDNGKIRGNTGKYGEIRGNTGDYGKIGKEAKKKSPQEQRRKEPFLVGEPGLEPGTSSSRC
jgi:hypothetical protein